MRHALIFNVISALTFVAAVFFLVTKGLHYLGRVHRRHRDGAALPAGGRPGKDPPRPAKSWATKSLK
jgi:hypothetical protein